MLAPPERELFQSRGGDARVGERGQRVRCTAFGAATAGSEHHRLSPAITLQPTASINASTDFAVPSFMRAYIPGRVPGRKFTYCNIRGGDPLVLQTADLLRFLLLSEPPLPSEDGNGGGDGGNGN